MREHSKKLILLAVGILQFALDVLLLGNIRKHSDPLAYTAVALQNGYGPSDYIAVRTVCGLDTEFDLVRRSRGERLSPYLADSVNVVRMNSPPPTAAHHFFFRLA